MLETCRVCGVTCDRNVNAFFPHDSYTFRYTVCTVTVYFCTKSFRISFSGYFFYFVCVWIILCLNECETVDSGDDLCSVFTQTVQDNTQRFFTNFVCFFCDTDRTFSSSERFVTCQECETFCFFFQQHFS